MWHLCHAAVLTMNVLLLLLLLPLACRILLLQHLTCTSA
jgi:hypothetical protein